MSIQFAARHRLYFASLASLLIASQRANAGGQTSAGNVPNAGQQGVKSLRGSPLSQTTSFGTAAPRRVKQLPTTAMSAAAAAPAQPQGERVPEQIETEDEQEGQVVFLVKWQGLDIPTWIAQADAATDARFVEVLAEWEQAKASGLAQGQEGESSGSDESGSESDEEADDGPSELERLGMEAAVRAAETGGSCATAAAAAAAAVRAGGGSKEDQASAASSAAAFVAVAQGLAPREAAVAAADAFDAAESAAEEAPPNDSDSAAAPAAAAAASASTSKRARDDGQAAAVAATTDSDAGSESAKKLARAQAPAGMSTEDEAAWLRTFEARFRSTLR
jgi:hypothetical protein